MNSLFTCLAGPMSFVLLLFAEHAMAKEPVCGRVLCGGRCFVRSRFWSHLKAGHIPKSVAAHPRRAS